MKSLMRSSWNNQNLMRKRLKNHVKTKISWDSHEIWWKAHENLMRIFALFSFLMRISWDSHENLQNVTRIFVRGDVSWGDDLLNKRVSATSLASQTLPTHSMHVKETQCTLLQAKNRLWQTLLNCFIASRQRKKAWIEAPQASGHTAERGLVARALDGSTSAAIFSTGPSRWAALFRDEAGFEYGKFPFKDQRRDRRETWSAVSQLHTEGKKTAIFRNNIAFDGSSPLSFPWSLRIERASLWRLWSPKQSWQWRHNLQALLSSKLKHVRHFRCRLPLGVTFLRVDSPSQNSGRQSARFRFRNSVDGTRGRKIHSPVTIFHSPMASRRPDFSGTESALC